MTVTVCIEDEQGKQQTHEVSDEFMELCFERAKAGENANEVQQTIIVDMVRKLLQTGLKHSMLRMLLDVLTK